ncbi:MAG: cell division protein FtsH, partial [Proteobacteria bacterium]|nr:cell division protein FtsH [Pseudomonadota bacterium]
MNNVQMGLLMLLLTTLGVVGYNVWLRETTPPTMTYTAFLADLDKSEIKKIHLRGGEITGENKKGNSFST